MWNVVEDTAPPLRRIRLGVSSCLLGDPVRFDGGHKRDPFITERLAEWFDFAPVCPEVAVGLGTPRQPIRLVGDPQRPRAVGVRDPALDVTGALQAYGRETAHALQGLAGFIVKRGSPSCGMERVRVYAGAGAPQAAGTGLFTRELMAAQPELPVEEEGRLNDPVLRENFIERVFVYDAWLQLRAEGPSPRSLVAFHARHKMSLLAHDPDAYRRLGRLVAEAGTTPPERLADEYIAALMQALRRPVTRRRHVNVLQHLAGYLKRRLDAGDRAELAECIHAYRRGELPLPAPLALLRHHLRRHPDPYAAAQSYLEPHPAALALRNPL